MRSGSVLRSVILPPSSPTRCTLACATATIRFPSVFTMSGSSTPASWTFVVECSGGAPPDSAVVPAESLARPCLGTAVVLSAAPAESVAVAPPARSIRYSGAWSLKYCRTVSHCPEHSRHREGNPARAAIARPCSASQRGCRGRGSPHRWCRNRLTSRRQRRNTVGRGSDGVRIGRGVEAVQQL